MRVPDEVRKCVAFIGLPHILKNEQISLNFRGSAFFVVVPSLIKAGKGFVYLVKAKHVATRLANKLFLIRVNTKDGASKLISGTDSRWWTHPSDDSVDVAVIPWTPPQEVEYKQISARSFLSDDIIKSENIGTGDEVFITGLFAHMSGSKRNIPIVRMGNIAMMPDELIPTRDLGNIDAYLIEARSLGGLSGSPAFVRKTPRIGLGSFYLLGLIHGHWDIPSSKKNGRILMHDDSLGKINMGIAIVVPARKIFEVINHPELVDMRQNIDAR